MDEVACLVSVFENVGWFIVKYAACECARAFELKTMSILNAVMLKRIKNRIRIKWLRLIFMST